MHIPPRATFFSQVFGATIGIPINYAVIRWVLNTRSDYLTGDKTDPSHQWTGQSVQQTLSTSVQYVLVVSPLNSPPQNQTPSNQPPGPHQTLPRTHLPRRPLRLPLRSRVPLSPLHPAPLIPSFPPPIPALEHHDIFLRHVDLLRESLHRLFLRVHRLFRRHVLGFPIQI